MDYGNIEYNVSLDCLAICQDEAPFKAKLFRINKLNLDRALPKRIDDFRHLLEYQQATLSVLSEDADEFLVDVNSIDWR